MAARKQTLDVDLKTCGCLALPRPTCGVTGLAVPLDLCDVSSDSLPSLDLARVLLRHAATHVIAAVPLEPAPRIVRERRGNRADGSCTKQEPPIGEVGGSAGRACLWVQPIWGDFLPGDEPCCVSENVASKSVGFAGVDQIRRTEIFR